MALLTVTNRYHVPSLERPQKYRVTTRILTQKYRMDPPYIEDSSDPPWGTMHTFSPSTRTHTQCFHLEGNFLF